MSDFSKSRHKPQGDLQLKIRIVLYICAHRTNTPHKMKFRTEINIKPFAEKIDHQSHIFSIGSCFAQYMADELLEAKFDICSNPFGVMFNPASIHAALLRLTKCELFSHEDILFDRDRWFSYDLHSSFDEINSQCILTQANASVTEGNMRLEDADWVVITFGTAWVYTLNESGAIVAANALVTSGMRVESGWIYAGVPAKKIKEVSPEQQKDIVERIANDYIMYASWYKEDERAKMKEQSCE